MDGRQPQKEEIHMSAGLVKQALETSDAYGLAIFPVTKNKTPLIKGWRDRATQDPAEIERLFSMPGAVGIGVPCGKDNDIICFDLDFGHTDDPARKAALGKWMEDNGVEADMEAGKCMVRRTRSGGLHIIYGRYPKKVAVPRFIMPKLDVIKEGFYFVWSLDDHYTLIGGDIVDAGPPEAMLEVIERTVGTGTGALPSSEEADEILRNNGDSGQRHEAVLRMTQDWTDDHPEQSKAELTQSFSDWFQIMYEDCLDEDRLGMMIERGEIKRAFDNVKPNAARVAATLDKAGAILAERGVHPPPLPPKDFIWMEQPAQKVIEGDLFSEYVPGEIDDAAAWLLEGLLRVCGNMGITGMSGVGKTTVSGSWIAGMISGRSDVVGLPPVERALNVAWLNAEEEGADMLQHVEAALHHHGLTKVGRLIVAGEETLDRSDDGLSLVIKKYDPAIRSTELVINEVLVDKIVEEMKAAQIDVMIADPITEFNDGNENDRGDAKKLNRAFKLIAQRAGVAVIYWAHTGQPPEGKRPDWYRDNLFAQRGSSQNIGSLKTAATHWHMVPPASKAGEAWEWVRKGKNADYPDVPNLTAITVIKVKKYATQWKMAYEIRSSATDADVPVAIPWQMADAEAMLDQSARSSADMQVALINSAIVERLGVGTHKRTDLNKALEGTAGWPKDPRMNRPNPAEFLNKWKRPQVVDHGGKQYSIVLDLDGESSFVFNVREVS